MYVQLMYVQLMYIRGHSSVSLNTAYKLNLPGFSHSLFDFVMQDSNS